MQFTIENIEDRDLQLYQINSDNATFTISDYTPLSTIPPGESTTFSVSFSGETTQTGKISVFTYDIPEGAYNQYDFYINADPYSLLRVYNDTTLISPTVGSYDFGDNFTTIEDVNEFSLHNEGPVSLTISGIVSSNSGVFYSSGVTLPINIPYNEVEPFNLVFSPSDSIQYNETITLLSNCSYNPIYTFNVSGSGLVPQPLLRINQSGVSIPYNGSYDFGVII